MANPQKVPSAAYLAFATAYVARVPDVSEGFLFGMKALKLGSKTFAGGFAGGLAVKLGDEAEALRAELDGATRFDPSGKGRPMKGWVVLPPSAESRWTEAADAARAQLQS